MSIKITAQHCRAAGMCLVPGVRDFFAHHQLDFKDFMRNGIDADELLKTNDAMARQVVAIAREADRNGK